MDRIFQRCFLWREGKSVHRKGSAATSTITLAELQEKYLREKWNTFELDIKFITNKTALIPVDPKVSLLAGKINFQYEKEKRDWGMSDSIILATAKISSAKVVTGDRHFKDIQEAHTI